MAELIELNNTKILLKKGNELFELKKYYKALRYYSEA